MARNTTTPEPRLARLSRSDMESAIQKIERRIAEIDALDPNTINDRNDPRISALEAKLDGLLSAVFGPDTVQYQRHHYQVTNLDRASISMAGPTPIAAVRAGIAAGLLAAKTHLQTIRTEFLEAIEDGIPAAEPDPGPQLAPLPQGVHPELTTKCGTLFRNAAYAEAVEMSFKVVRDKLRRLSGYETGSDAFGKGNLHIRGAAAQHVEVDFNQAVKFLLMAIDMFRNEKSHTSDARITDPTRALQYLMVSSLALALLDQAEVRP